MCSLLMVSVAIHSKLTNSGVSPTDTLLLDNRIEVLVSATFARVAIKFGRVLDEPSRCPK